MELVDDVGVRVYPVGRLDLNSEGLLIFTNDGEFANMFLHPSSGNIKVYEVHVDGNIQKSVELLKKPVTIFEDEGTKEIVVKAVDVDIISKTEVKGIINISIVEGRNRQVRKMCTQCGLKVTSLKRISISNVTLGTLKTGKWRHLTENEVKTLG